MSDSENNTVISKAKPYVDKLKDSIYWWLGKKRPFYINGEYCIELKSIDKKNNSAKIVITNIKDNEIITQDIYSK